MKQIFVGSTQRAKLHNEIAKAILSTRIVIAIVIALLLIIPISFAKKIFILGNGEMSPVAYIETISGFYGSAVFIGNDLLLTAAHVVGDMELNEICTVKFENPNSTNNNSEVITGAELLARGNLMLRQDEDFALLRIMYLDASEYAKPYALGDDKHTKVQDRVNVIGYPGRAFNVTDGIVGNIKGGILEEDNIIVVDAKANPGNSGGALINANEQLIGIVVPIGNKQKVNDDQTYALKIGKIKKSLMAKGFNI